MKEAKKVDRWGCPNWREPQGYPNDPFALADWEWKWQFVRRQSRYRKYWRDFPFCVPIETPPEEVSRLSAPVHEKRPAFAHRRLFAYDYSLRVLPDPSVPNLDENPFTSRFDGVRVQQVVSLPELLEEISDRSNLVHSDLMRIFDELHWPVVNVADSRASNNHIVVFKFDLKRSLKPQLQKVEKELKEMQEENFPDYKQFKKRRENWVRHLRVIDAKDQGAKHAEIFLQFVDDGIAEETAVSQPNALVSQWHDQAIEVMEKASRLL